MRVQKKLPSFQAVAAGQTAIANLPKGMAYHQIILFCKDTNGVVEAGTLATFADEVRIIVDGDTKVQLTGAQYEDLLNYYNHTIVDGAFPLHFSRPWQRTMGGEDETAYGTKDMQSFTIEVDIASGVLSPSLEAYAVMGPNANLEKHVAIRRFGQTYAGGAGQFEVSDIPRGPYHYLAAHIASAEVSKVEVEANQRTVWDMPEEVAMAYAQQPTRERAWQTGYYHVDFALTNRLGDALPATLDDFRFTLTMDGADASFPFIVERVEGISGR